MACSSSFEPISIAHIEQSVIEDLVELLIDKNVIMITELPQAAQQKLMGRKSARELFNKDTMLIVDKDDIL